MYTTTLLFSALMALVSASPVQRDTYYGTSINVNVASGLDPNPVYEPAPVQMNVLTSLNNVSASSLTIDRGVAVNINIEQVECRAYKDDAGVVPGSAPFTVNHPAELSTNLVEVASVLCYIVTEGEEDSSD